MPVIILLENPDYLGSPRLLTLFQESLPIKFSFCNAPVLCSKVVSFPQVFLNWE